MIDLHTHSYFSDGSDSPEQLVQKAHNMGLYALALTDHDVVDGCPELLAAGKKFNDARVIMGSELGVDHPAGMEIIALNIKDLAPYQERQRQLIEIRNNANRERIAKLNECGFAISWQDVAFDENGAPRKLVGKPHIAEAMFKKGYVTSKDEVYSKYLAKGCPAYAKKHDPDTRQTIDFIRQTGAVAILAHPCLIRLKGLDLFNEVKRLQSWGLQGIEVMHSDMTPDQMREYNEMADTLGLLKSGGSDYHGAKAHPDVELGTGRGNLNIPNAFIDRILKASK